MPNKTQEYLNLAQQTAKELTRYWENWTDYLTTASRLYKYNFADQLMIYAQRPDATACASFDLWNDRMNRYVRRGSKGIALLDQSSSVPRLHYVFDVSDTGVRRNSRDPEVWQLGPDLVQPVSEMLAREYGVRHERITQQIADICGKLVDSYWDNSCGDIPPLNLKLFPSKAAKSRLLMRLRIRTVWMRSRSCCKPPSCARQGTPLPDILVFLECVR